MDMVPVSWGTKDGMLLMDNKEPPSLLPGRLQEQVRSESR